MNDDISKRLAALSPEQRELLELRMRKKGLQTPAAREEKPQAPVAFGQSANEPEPEEDRDAWRRREVERSMQFSLYFFSGNGSTDSHEKYRLVMESAKYADAHGFTALWSPERHFQDFGGLYPNPSVLSAALAAVTERIQIRAGSVALPLHNPVRVAEEWAVVDNISGGRVGISFASGWHPDDFVFAPHSYEDRKEVMYQGIEMIKRLWAGESVTLPGVEGKEVQVRTLPRPIQTNLPIWVTTAGNPQTWTRAGEVGANVFGALTGYTYEELGRMIALYREARARHGHDPAAGRVTIMLHTYIGETNREVKDKVRGPLSDYLKTYFKQYENVRLDPSTATEEDKRAIAALAFEYYFDTALLCGTQNKCARMIERLTEVGVDEIACLVDFGIDADSVLRSLEYLNELREHYQVEQSLTKSAGR